MIYNGIETDEKGYPKVCPRCGNEQMDGRGHCKICGVELVNRCSDWSCDGGTPADTNARYCTKCGSHTIYFEQRFLQPWDEVKAENNQNNSV